ncbi:hypothetical protein K503DRAFT_869092 [Rhizopogon vinicolor AM-OR11-026]|uniref:Uncharacterized protein n=1 Tax=Rhizopogon vinicolor AM-OR11-026 TaxID=1314800 RepID=A0A1B7MNK4_9AGAM|nr:hypothetical protein K503DRAFT_869092 [Rhizopogon vinicolor AM-OR11-026]
MTLQPKKVLSPSAAGSEDHRLRLSIPAYAGLILGNILLEFLSFSEHPFPVTPSSLFPTLAGTNIYLKAFALPFIESGHIRLRRRHEDQSSERRDGVKHTVV